MRLSACTHSPFCVRPVRQQFSRFFFCLAFDCYCCCCCWSICFAMCVIFTLNIRCHCNGVGSCVMSCGMRWCMVSGTHFFFVFNIILYRCSVHTVSISICVSTWSFARSLTQSLKCIGRCIFGCQNQTNSWAQFMILVTCLMSIRLELKHRPYPSNAVSAVIFFSCVLSHCTFVLYFIISVWHLCFEKQQQPKKRRKINEIRYNSPKWTIITEQTPKNPLAESDLTYSLANYLWKLNILHPHFNTFCVAFVSVFIEIDCWRKITTKKQTPKW